ncbi:MAG: fatty acid desaturase [Bacteroidota bacterium]
MTIDKKITSELKGWGAITRKYVTPDHRKATVQLLNTIPPFLAIWGLMYWSLDYSYALTLLLSLLNGLFLVRIFVIQHDCGHQSFLKSTKMNNFIGTFCSILTSIPYQYWSKVHGYHHTHSGQLEVRDIGDIDFLTVQEYHALSPIRKRLYALVRFPLVLFFFAPLGYLIYSNRYPLRFKEERKILFMQLLNNILIFSIYGILAYFLGWKNFVLIQLPVLIVFVSVAFWFFYVQHQHEFAYKNWEKDWNYLLSAIRGSTYYDLPPILHWFSANIGYHHIHHLNCGIPNYNLAKCAEENPIFQKYVTKINLRESLQCMSNKLWDEKSERMITFKEYRKIKMSE